jgi:hypothetical protein
MGGVPILKAIQALEFLRHFCLDAFSRRERVSTSLEKAIVYALIRVQATEQGTRT